MWLSCIKLAIKTSFDNFLSIRLGGEPKETLPESVGYEGPGSGVMPSITKVDLSEYLNVILL